MSAGTHEVFVSRCGRRRVVRATNALTGLLSAASSMQLATSALEET